MKNRTSLWALGLAGLLSLTGCGGGGGGGAPDGGGQGVDAPPIYATGPLRAEIQFPPDGSLGKCGQITVRGTAGGRGITGVRVNGIAAEGFGEFGEWIARIPLVCGSNLIRVDVEDSPGTGLTGADIVRLEVLDEFVYLPGAIGAGTEPGAVYVVDRARGEVVAVNFDQGTRTALGFAPTYSVSGRLMVDDGGRNLFLQNGFELLHYEAGDGGRIWTRTLEGEGGGSIGAVASDVDHDRFFAAIGQRIYEYATETGTRSLRSSPYSSDMRGDGPGQSAQDGLAYGPDLDAVFSASGSQILRTNLTTGDRIIMTTTAAEADEEVTALAYDGDSRRLLIYALRKTSLYAAVGVIYGIDLTTGIRRPVSGPEAGNGVDLPAIGRSEYITLEYGADNLYVSDEQRGHVVEVELATGDRRVVVHHQVGNGPAVLAPADALLDPATGRIILGNALDNVLLSVDLATGNRTLLSGKTRGSGPELVNLEGLVAAFGQGAVFALDPALSAVVRIDLANGNRTIISDDTVGIGTPFARAVDISRGPDPGKLYVADKLLGHPALRGAIVSVDIATGNRTTLSDGFISLTIPWLEITGMAYDGVGGRFLTSDRDQQYISAIDDSSGLRSLVSDNDNNGIGLPYESPSGLNLDLPRGRALVSDLRLGGMFSVDLASGDRILLYDREHGRGPLTSYPRAAIPHPLPGQLIVLDAYGSAVLVVDEASGDRVIISK